MAALGLCCCTQAFSSCGEQRLLFVAVHGLLTAVASLALEHRLQGVRASVVVGHGLSCPVACGTGIEPVSPALPGRFLTT